MAKEIHTYDEQRGINNTRYQYPFPQFVFLYEPVGLEISLNASNHFFQHIGEFRFAKLTHSVVLWL